MLNFHVSLPEGTSGYQRIASAPKKYHEFSPLTRKGKSWMRMIWMNLDDFHFWKKISKYALNTLQTRSNQKPSPKTHSKLFGAGTIPPFSSTCPMTWGFQSVPDPGSGSKVHLVLATCESRSVPESRDSWSVRQTR